MIFKETSLQGAFVIEPQIYQDNRGQFLRYFCEKEFEKIGFKKKFVQLNHSITNKKGTIRGMHYQIAPLQEAKLVKCIKGKIFDVIIDLRKDSPSFLNWFGIELSEQNKIMLFIPEGFAHGFQTLEENCELLYHHSEFYSPEYEAGIIYNDPLIKIEWKLPVSEISERDLSHKQLTKNFKGI